MGKKNKNIFRTQILDSERGRNDDKKMFKKQPVKSWPNEKHRTRRVEKTAKKSTETWLRVGFCRWVQCPCSFGLILTELNLQVEWFCLLHRHGRKATAWSTSSSSPLGLPHRRLALFLRYCQQPFKNQWILKILWHKSVLLTANPSTRRLLANERFTWISYHAIGRTCKHNRIYCRAHRRGHVTERRNTWSTGQLHCLCKSHIWRLNFAHQFQISTFQGLDDPDSDDKKHFFGSYFYDNKKDEKQYFRAQNTARRTFIYVKVQVNSNHGNQQYTCLYRFQVHGFIDRAYHCQ